jgi:hypothetical protein
MSPIRSKEMQSEVNGWELLAMSCAECRWGRCDAFLTIRADDVAVTAIRPDGSGENATDVFQAHTACNRP